MHFNKIFLKNERQPLGIGQQGGREEGHTLFLAPGSKSAGPRKSHSGPQGPGKQCFLDVLVLFTDLKVEKIMF